MNGNLAIGTPAQSEQWYKARKQVFDIGDLLFCLRGRAANAALAYRWGSTHGFKPESPAALEKRLSDLENQYRTIKTAVDRVDDRIFAIQFRNGDIDIVNPAAEMGAVVLVVVAVVAAGIVIAGLGAACLTLWRAAKETDRQYNNLLGATDRVFCREGSPNTCAQWEQYKKESGYQERQTTLDKTISGIGGAVVTGTKWGIAAALPLLLIAFLWRQK